MTLVHPRSALLFLACLHVVFILSLRQYREADLFVSHLTEPCDCAPRSSQLDISPSPSPKPASLREQVELATKEEVEPFPRVAVLNLASRPDRREHMKLLGEVHSLNLTFVDATPYTSPEIVWLLERMYDESRNINWTFNTTEDETWKHHFLTTPSFQLQPPPSPTLPSNVSALLDFPQPVNGVESLPGPLACFVSHLDLLRRIVAEDWGTTIVLEDDVDLEWRFSEVWNEVVGKSIPKELEWELIYLGYSFSTEERFEPVHHPNLRPTYSPLGTYAYAISPRGAVALLDFISQPENFVSLPIDHIYRRFNSLDEAKHQQSSEERQVLSFTPAVVAHGGQHAFGTDIGGTSNIYLTKMADSTMDRLDRYREVLTEEGMRERERKEKAGVGALSS